LQDDSRIVYELSDSKFVSLPESGLIVCTNDKVLMNTILSRWNAWWLDRVALPADLIEWKYVNQWAPYWSMRHFSHSDDSSGRDFSSGMQDKQAIGLTFSYNLEPYSLQMTYVSSHTAQESIASQLLTKLDSSLAQHVFSTYVDNIATQLTVSEPQRLRQAVYIALEWFNPPFKIEVEKIRHGQRH